MSSNILSPYQMAEIEKLTKELEDIHATVKERNNQIENVLGAFKVPIRESRKYVYHVSGFKLKAMFDILFGKGLKWNKKDKGIFYNVTEYLDYMDAYGIFKLGKTRDRRHVSYYHGHSFFFANGNTGDKDCFGRPIIFAERFSFLRRFGLIPILLTYEIDTQGFEKEVYEDPACQLIATAVTASDGTSCFARYIPQERIPSKYIRLKAISFAFPWLYPIFGYGALIDKVLWRRK